SEYTRELVTGRIIDRELDVVLVKGKKKPVRVYEVLGRSGESTPEQEELWELYSEGLSNYRERRWQEGIEAFSAALAIDGNDRPSNTYLRRCKEYLANPPPQEWDGTFSVAK
ncbi:MAG: adenylate/guanylate cyclase domain-containing protein, partial [Kiritimatiellia bacterium]|nr:adenylate/guanylate cyclase domain-containing protein [Kiritimatiellia bacterium]